MDQVGEVNLTEMKEALIRLVAQIRCSLEESTKSAKPVLLDQQAVGRLSRVDALQQQKMAQAGKRNQQRRLAQADAALRRLEAGEYGACLSCDEPISQARLTARPEAPFCLSCQSHRETKA